MDRLKRLAAEFFGYSYANYADHLGIGNERYERLMPQTVATLERADRDGWSVLQVAEALKVDVEQAEEMCDDFERARDIVDAENPSEAFRHGVRYSILDALEDGLEGADAIEKLVTQICYRAADLAVLLEQEGKPLSRYSRHLRREPEVGYYEGYFDEESE